MNLPWRIKRKHSGFRIWNWKKIHQEKKETAIKLQKSSVNEETLKEENQVDLEEQNDDVLGSEYEIGKNFIGKRKEKQQDYIEILCE